MCFSPRLTQLVISDSGINSDSNPKGEDDVHSCVSKQDKFSQLITSRGGTRHTSTVQQQQQSYSQCKFNHNHPAYHNQNHRHSPSRSASPVIVASTNNAANDMKSTRSNPDVQLITSATQTSDNYYNDKNRTVSIFPPSGYKWM